MQLITSKPINNANFKPIMLSTDHIIYDDELVGVIQEDKLSTPTVDKIDRSGKGVPGIANRSSQYKEQPVSLSVKYNEALNRVHGIITNQNPDLIEKEENKVEGIGQGGEIGLNENFDILENQINRNNDKYVKSMMFFNCGQNELDTTIPNNDYSTVDYTGVADRGYMFDLPLYLEGWGHKITIAEQAVPDLTVQLSKGCNWLRRDAGSFVPRKAYLLAMNSSAFVNPAANPYYGSLVAYENTNDGYSDLLLTIVYGAEAASPVKSTDTEIETAIDLLSSGARWCRLCDIEIAVATTTIIDSMIELPALAIYTLNNTSIPVSTEAAADGWFQLSWSRFLLMLKQAGEHKQNNANISSMTATTLTLSSAITDMIELAYLIQCPADVWNALS